MNKLHKSAFTVLATIVMGLSLFTNTAAKADEPGVLTATVTNTAGWHFGDDIDVTEETSGDPIVVGEVADHIEYETVFTTGDSCAGLVANEPYYAGTYTATVHAIVTRDGISYDLLTSPLEGYVFTSTPVTFTVLPYVMNNTVDHKVIYQGQGMNTSGYTIGSLPYGITATMELEYSGGGLSEPTLTQPRAVGTYVVTPRFAFVGLDTFAVDAACNFLAVGPGSLEVIPSIDPGVNPTIDPTPTPTATPSPSATPLKKATITVTGGTYSYDGSPKSATVTTNPAGLSVSVKYAGGSSAPVNSGTYGVVATITAKDYEATEASGTIVINKINPILKWNKPAKIKQGTPVTSKQLNATANVKGTFTYTVDSGAVLAVGTYDAVADFAPEDAVNYNTARTQTVIEVVPGARSIVVTFSLGSAKIPASVLANIRANAALPGEKVIVYGYVQPSNSLSADKELSQQRADALAAQILKLVPSANVVAIGKGRTTNALCVSANNKCAVVEFAGK